MSAVEQVCAKLKTFSLRGILETLPQEIELAEKKHPPYTVFLDQLLDNEISYRNTRRLHRNLAAAHFPAEKSLDTFQLLPGLTGVSPKSITQWETLNWIDTHTNQLFFGPPGLGKTHLAIALGYLAVYAGYKVCFERMHNLMKLFQTEDIQRASTFRLRKLLQCDLIIFDEIGYVPIDRAQANRFFTLISELYEKSTIIITSNTSFEDWAELLGDPVLTTALLDRLLHHAQCYTMSGMSYRLSYSKQEDTK